MGIFETTTALDDLLEWAWRFADTELDLKNIEISPDSVEFLFE